MSQDAAPTPPPLQTPPPSGDWREMRREERRARRADRHAWANGAPIGALVLIALGLVLFLQNFGLHLPENWWAFFFLIPAVGSFVTAQRRYQQDGKIDGEVIGLMVSGAIFAGLFAAFYFRFDWGYFGPIVLIAIGIGIIARQYWRPGD
ncbi:MAG TPA: hypothetical protein VG757_09545 [Devosia sp.]|nr:hypothetical protein [Devosia sp.]